MFNEWVVLRFSREGTYKVKQCYAIYNRHINVTSNILAWVLNVNYDPVVTVGVSIWDPYKNIWRYVDVTFKSLKTPWLSLLFFFPIVPNYYSRLWHPTNVIAVAWAVPTLNKYDVLPRYTMRGRDRIFNVTLRFAYIVLSLNRDTRLYWFFESPRHKSMKLAYARSRDMSL